MKMIDIITKAKIELETEKSVPVKSFMRKRKMSNSSLKFINSIMLFVVLLLTVVTQSFAGTYTVLGSQTITRSKGTPIDEMFSFSVRDPSARYELHISIGDISVSSADLLINGITVVGSKSFNANVTEIIQGITVKETNELLVKLASKPDSYLTTSVIGYDDVAPEITASISPVANVNGWHKSTVVVSFSCSDKTSGIKICPAPVTLDLDGANQIVSGTAIDKAGNQATTSVTIDLDKTAATINSLIAPTPNSAGWNNTDLSISYQCEDSLSGVASCSPTVQINQEGTLQTSTGTVVDLAGNQTTTIVTISLDKTAPNLNVSANPVANARGWNNSSVNLIYSCSDSLSGIASCADSNLIETEGQTQISTATALDVAGNTTNLSTTLNIDLTEPYIISSILPLSNNAGWHKTDPTISYKCGDSLSGILTCPADITHTSEGEKIDINATAIDNADNKNTLATNISLDKIIPTINFAITPVANTNGWHNTDATVSFTCNDTLSGVASCETQVVVATEAAAKIVSGKVIDVADNEATTTATVKLDKTAPTITATLTPVSNAAGWHKASAIVSFTCNDALSGIQSCTSPITVNAESAANIITGTAVDKAGNSTETAVTIKLDLTAPIIGSSVAPLANTNGWHKTDATITFICDDNLSGVASCESSIVVTTEAATQAVIGKAVDIAGNEATTAATIKLDKTTPTITATITPIANEAGWHNGSAIVSFTCEDSLSGIESCTAPITVNTESASNVITGTALDKAGNSTETSVTLKIDLTKPIINTNVVPTANTNGWHKTDPIVNFICSDVLSSIATCNAPITVTTEAENQTVSGVATDKANNSATTSTVINLDKTAPTITTQLVPIANSSGWHNGDVVVSFICNDMLSGIETCPAPITVSTEGQAQIISGTAIDKAGNTATTSATLNIDLSIPNIDTTISPTPNNNGWNNTDITVSYICLDALSGVKNCPADKMLTTEGQAQLISGSASDIAGNTANTSNLINIDKTAPTITSQVQPLANAAGWNNTMVIVSFTCNDTLSGVEICPTPITVDLEVANKVISGIAIDKAGNTATTSLTLNIDKTAAEINATISPLANSAGWNNTDVTVNFACNDSLSGVANCQAAQILTTEAASQNVAGNATDVAGNTSSTSITVNIDKTLPNISSVLTPSANANGWFNTDPTINYTCTDNLSGIASCNTAQTITLEAENQIVSATAVDVAGNSASVSDTINLDKTAPQINASVAPAANAQGWNNSTVVVTFTCTDSLSGIDSCSAPVTVDLDTLSQTVNGTAIDKAGNSSETSVTVKLDKTNPIITLAPSPVANAAGWFNADTTITATCSDALSGVATCPTTQQVNTEGAAQVVEMSAVDVAGNTATATLNMNIDKTAPLISALSTPIANANGWNNTDVTITHSCEDALSGIATCTAEQTITTEGANQTIIGDAVDIADNTASITTTLNIDKTAPQLSFVSPLNGSVQTTNPPSLILELTDNLSIDNASLEIIVNGLLVAPSCQFNQNQVVCALSTPINDVAATITAQIADLAGNTTTATSQFNFDNDADGVIDAIDAFPTDPTEWADLDNDGTGDNSDPDRDGDGFSNEQELLAGFDDNDPTSTPPDLDGDFIPDSLDSDRDGDGVANEADAFPDNATESADLDGDGIGDNTDDDIDGDGYSNADEIAAGSNPNDATDFPDSIAPVVTLNGSNTRTTELDTVELSGTVTDDSSGVASVVITSDRHVGLSFDTTLTAGQWATSVPIELGTNQLTVIATDVANNTSNITLVVEKTEANLEIALTIDYPTTNLVVTAPNIVIRGKLQSNKPALQMNVLVNGLSATLNPTSQVTVFNFESATVTLAEGLNNITVQANVDGQSIQRSVFVTYQKEVTQVDAPLIAILSPAVGSYQTGTSITIAGRVTTTAGLKTLTINNQAVAFSNNAAPDYNFQDIVNFATGSSELIIVIVATDELNQTTQKTVSYYRDQTAPVIQVQQSLLSSPEVNVIHEQPYTLSGTITDINLASFFINDSAVGLLPLGNGVYNFDTQLTLAQTAPLDLVLVATDQAGNQTSLSYTVQIDASVNVSILQPENNAELLSTGVASNLSVTARIEGNAIPQGITSTATLFNETGVTQSTTNLVISNGLATGEIAIPALAGNYTLEVDVLDIAGVLLSKTNHQLSVIDSSTIAVEVARVQPQDNETGIEPNESISLFFNKPIDITKLVVKVHETAHGNTYIDMDELGTDGIKAKGYQLQPVNRDYQLVNGNLSVLPNNQVVAFYPEIEFAYGGTVFVDVTYDGEELLRSQFKTRSLPTFVTGFVVDQLNQPIPGIQVRIPALSRTTKTNSEGAYAFGYGDSDKNILPGGSYTVEYNNGLKNPLFGNHTKEINIQKHHRNTISSISLPVLNRAVPFVPAAGRQTVNLLQGSLKLDLTQADLQFPDGRRNGDIHTQVLTYSQIPYSFDRVAAPLFAYSTQPAGIAIEGDITIDMAIPTLNGSYSHVPDDGIYVMLVGLSQEFGRIVPIGVGEIQNKRVLSRGKVHLQHLDYIGYGLIMLQTKTVVEQYINNEISLPELISEVRQIHAGS